LLVDAYLDFLKKQVEPDRIPDLLIAGPGWESDYARGIQNRMGKAPKIHTSGMLEGDSKWGALHGCEAFILPSHQENFGIAVVEALACNKLVLISDKVNIWREIADDSAGLVEPDTLDGTKALLTAFRDRGAAPSTRFRDCFTKRFCIQSAAQKMRGSLENLLTCP
jgi:glycosyltransferase involved in cell wall biosynthesis